MCVLKKQLPNLLPSSAASNQQPVLLVAIGSGFQCKLFSKIKVLSCSHISVLRQERYLRCTRSVPLERGLHQRYLFFGKLSNACSPTRAFIRKGFTIYQECITKENKGCGKIILLTFKPQYPQAYSPHRSPYISHVTS